MRTFRLQRDIDETGISGVGVVAEGVEFGDGSCVVRWTGERASTVCWSSISDVEAIHGHGGKTRVEWLWTDSFAHLDLNKGEWHPYISGCVYPASHDGPCAILFERFDDSHGCADGSQPDGVAQ